MNDSSTGGPLVPLPGSPAPLEGQALNRFLQQYFVGLFGFSGTQLVGATVRPAIQTEPPNIPPAFSAWMAFNVKTRPGDSFPAVVHMPSGYDQLQRHQTLVLRCSFYDTGTNGQADFYADFMKDALAIAQNREPLQLAGMGLIDVEEPVVVPSLLKERWLYRTDLVVNLRRVILRNYGVLNIESLDAEIVAQPDGSAATITINLPTPEEQS